MDHKTTYGPIIDKLRAVNEYVAAEVLDHSVITLRNWRSRGRGPRYIKSGRRVTYLLEYLARWIEQNRIDPEVR